MPVKMLRDRSAALFGPEQSNASAGEAAIRLIEAASRSATRNPMAVPMLVGRNDARTGSGAGNVRTMSELV